MPNYLLITLGLLLLPSAASAASGLYNFLKDVESDKVAKLTAYQDTGGVWTIGFGSIYNFDLNRRVRQGDTITLEQANRYLKLEADKCLNLVKQFVKVPLTKNQTIALASFIYNCGETAFKNSTLLKLINSKANRSQIESEFRKWLYDEGRFIQGLLNRRNAEIELFYS